MGELGWEKILIIAVVILVLFGSKKIPEMMRGLGRGVREFNDAKKGISNDNSSSAASSQSSNITDVEHEPVAK